jgi:hypothetical protein
VRRKPVVCSITRASVVAQRRFACADVSRRKAFLVKLSTFQAVVKGTANYEWFETLIEPLADRAVLTTK